MGEYEFAAWRRYGHDRVYVQRAGERLGYLDRTTGTLAVDGALADDVRAALVAAGWLDPPPPTVPALEWAITLPGDTATYRPGASARAQAQAVRDAAPVRTALARVLRVHTDERAWRVGADGEETVARRLARLPEPWTVVHDLPIGDNGANVDHLAVGPGGVFSLNTKNLTGRVWVGGGTFLHNGQKQPYVPKARREAERVGRLLGVPVHGVIVVIADDLTVKEQPREVAVVSADRIRRWLQSRPPTLSPDDLTSLVRRVRDPRTWGAPRA
ncbi:MAG TPA: nuclease-related domain-containing protein [Frankiaceae bacterium]|nr:nuclease-related domain-containing protein [Frankiaceae bacterium]